MKKTILKSAYLTLFAAGIIASLTSCSKEHIGPKGVSENTMNAKGMSSNSTQATLFLNQPTIYGVITGGIPGKSLYTIDPATGAVLTQKLISWTGGGGIGGAAIYGIAKVPGQNTAYMTTTSQCYTSTSNVQFYSIDLGTGLANMLGSTTGLTQPIRDIECHPITKVVYGIYGNYLVRITNFGTMCVGTGVPATYEILGDLSLSNLGAGPYSISFNYLGDCAIMSAIDHKRCYVNIPATAPVSPSTPLSIIGGPGNVIQGVATNLYSVLETASCISGTTQFIAIEGQTTSNPISLISTFYKWAATSTGTLYYQPLGNYCMADYTSDASSGIIGK